MSRNEPVQKIINRQLFSVAYSRKT